MYHRCRRLNVLVHIYLLLFKYEIWIPCQCWASVADGGLTFGSISLIYWVAALKQLFFFIFFLSLNATFIIKIALLNIEAMLDIAPLAERAVVSYWSTRFLDCLWRSLRRGFYRYPTVYSAGLLCIIWHCLSSAQKNTRKYTGQIWARLFVWQLFLYNWGGGGG